MRHTHLGGEKVSVDFAGYTIDIFDPTTGEAHPMKLSVAGDGVGARNRRRSIGERRKDPKRPDMRANPVGEFLH
ncbi:hypothetical protein X770_30770 [Mesorhizobium sp. LSJC269B00]|nr:hypothetical protein X770_30770 [Mesorhizobium sp. LSJC269B00]